MGYVMHSRDFGLHSDRTARVGNGIGVMLARLGRFLTGAFAQQRQSEVDREVARVLARSGGRITDSVEREMMQKALQSDWSLPQ